LSRGQGFLKEENMSLIVAENIHKDYEVVEAAVKALKGVSFEIEPAYLSGALHY
jgi:hypothetical protein